MRLRDIVLGAMLAAVAVAIPLTFGFARIIIPPSYTATLASHVPIMVAMFIGPMAAGVAGLGSAFGFLVALGPEVGARAATHIVWGILGAYLYRGGMSPVWILGVTLPIHALGEALVLLPFGISLAAAFLITGLGTAAHHALDAVITLAVVGTLVRAGLAFPEMRGRGRKQPRVK